MRKNEVSLGEALQSFLNKSRMKPKLTEVRIQELWEKLMGKTIARYTDKIQLVNRKLIITTNVAPLKQELSYSKAKIIQVLNEELGETVIDEVVIK
jgi:predicted nucleic acid-binding Zn ribbon protein